MRTHLSQDTGGGTGAPADAAAAAAAATGPETEEPGVAERLRAAARYFTVGFLLLAGAGGAAWLAWDRDSRRELDAALAEVHAAGLDRTTDDDLPHALVPPEENAATLYLRACDLIPPVDAARRQVLSEVESKSQRRSDRGTLEELQRALDLTHLPADLLARARALPRCIFPCDAATAAPCYECRAAQLDHLLRLATAYGVLAARAGDCAAARARFQDAIGLLNALGSNPCPARRAHWGPAARTIARGLRRHAPAEWKEADWGGILTLLPAVDTPQRFADEAARIRIIRALRAVQAAAIPLLPSDPDDPLASGWVGAWRERLGRPRLRRFAAFALRWFCYETGRTTLPAVLGCEGIASIEDFERTSAAWPALVGPVPFRIRSPSMDSEAQEILALARAGVNWEAHHCRAGRYPETAAPVRFKSGRLLRYDHKQSALVLEGGEPETSTWRLRQSP
ncbi:MAG: hypothetical protein HZA54_13705 [Planctomycetes bacterium]|nr:hypothetical protein [Planctomycetota bacterium]